MKLVRKIPATVTRSVMKDGKEEKEEVETHITGTITVNQPGANERSKFVRECRFKEVDGKIEECTDEEFVERIADLGQKFVMAVDAEMEIDGEKVKVNSLEDLGASWEGSLIIGKILLGISRGAQLGKS